MNAEELKEKIADIVGVEPVSADEQAGIRRNTAYALPDSPVSHGMRASQVRPAFWRGIVGEKDGDGYNVVFFLNRLAAALNTDLETLRAVLTAIVERCETDYGMLADFVAAEEGERKAADTALGGRLDAEQRARESLDERVALLEKIGDVVVDGASGYMTGEQAWQLAQLVAMWEEDPDTMINTVAEVLAAFESAPEGVNVVNALASKVARATAPSECENSVGQLYAVDLELSDVMVDACVAAEPNSVLFRDDEGRAKMADPVDDLDIVNKKTMENADRALGGRLDAEQAARRQAEVRISHGEKRLENLEARLDPEDFVTDDTTTYQKTVPATALPYASVSKIGTAFTPENLFVTFNAITDTESKYEDSFYDGFHEDTGSYASVSHDAADPTIMRISCPHTNNCRITLGKIRLPAGTYTMSGAPGGNEEEGYVSIRLAGVETFEDKGTGVTFDWAHGVEEELALSVEIDISSGSYWSGRDEVCKIMLVAGSEQAPHVPKGTYNQYVKVTKVVSKDSSGSVIDTFEIPESVQSMFTCDGDEVDFDARVLRSYVVTAVLPTSGWTKSTSYFSLKLKTAGLPNHNTNKAEQSTLTGGYEYEKNSSRDMTWWLVNSLSTHYLRVKDSRFATLDEFTAYLESNPLTVVYMASKQQEMDISALLPLDNLIRVGGGGTLTFVNECGMPIPSTITYQQEVSE
ncbi:MAG: hypothetical protein IJC99_04220 [Clostridia bacterium]|nr:hypothetical protein [Clostridia bacterium]